MDLQVERQALSPGWGDVGADGKEAGGQWGKGCCRSREEQSLGPPSLCGPREGGTHVPRLSIGPCSCLFCLCCVPSGLASRCSSGPRPHLTVQSADLLLVGRGQEEAAHLPLQWLLHLHVNVIARCLLLVRRVHTARRSSPWPSPAPMEAKGPGGRCGGEGGGAGRAGRMIPRSEERARGLT